METVLQCQDIASSESGKSGTELIGCPENAPVLNRVQSGAFCFLHPFDHSGSVICELIAEPCLQFRCKKDGFVPQFIHTALYPDFPR